MISQCRDQIFPAYYAPCVFAVVALLLLSRSCFGWVTLAYLANLDPLSHRCASSDVHLSQGQKIVIRTAKHRKAEGANRDFQGPHTASQEALGRLGPSASKLRHCTCSCGWIPCDKANSKVVKKRYKGGGSTEQTETEFLLNLSSLGFSLAT